MTSDNLSIIIQQVPHKFVRVVGESSPFANWNLPCPLKDWIPGMQYFLVNNAVFLLFSIISGPIQPMT